MPTNENAGPADDQLFLLVVGLSHDLAVALEMSYEPREIRYVWSEAVGFLSKAAKIMALRGYTLPATVANVIDMASRADGD